MRRGAAARRQALSRGQLHELREQVANRAVAPAAALQRPALEFGQGVWPPPDRRGAWPQSPGPQVEAQLQSLALAAVEAQFSLAPEALGGVERPGPVPAKRRQGVRKGSDWGWRKAACAGFAAQAEVLRQALPGRRKPPVSRLVQAAPAPQMAAQLGWRPPGEAVPILEAQACAGTPQRPRLSFVEWLSAHPLAWIRATNRSWALVRFRALPVRPRSCRYGESERARALLRPARASWNGSFSPSRQLRSGNRV